MIVGKRGLSTSAGPAAGDPGVLCRSLQPVATRHQREHEWVAAPVPAQEHGLVGLYPARVECHRPSPEHAPTEMCELRHAPGSLGAPAPLFTRCTWNLKPPSFFH